MRERTRTATTAVAIVFLCVGACGGSDRQTPAPGPSPASGGGSWRQVWNDEFDAPDGSAPDGAKWVYDIGGGGWGNEELESYTDRRENSVIRNGMLVITARKERHVGRDGIERPYTSARLKTLGTFSQAYGRSEARMRLPRGQGVWPAFWMLGDDIERAGWPASGEIDIMENIGREPALVHGTIHGPGYAGGEGIGAPFSSRGGAFAEDFHVYGVEWEPGAIRWYVDGTLYQTRTPSDLPAGTKWVFDHPFFMLVNLAIGGSWPGNPDDSTTFPQELVVDWVRVSARQ
jgi:beta-glucanase (GH16 family)